MRRISVLGAVLLFSLLLGIGTGADKSYSTPTVKVASGDLAAHINSFVAAIPGEGTNAYKPPTSLERSKMVEAYDAIEAGNLSQAASILDPLSYDVVQYEDTVTGRTSILLSERRNQDGSWPHAWGMYVFSPEATSDTTVEVPHPVADWNTEDVGVGVFREANAEDLFIAGAHRNANPDKSADVAHADESVFEGIHEAAIEPPTAVVQSHGYSQMDHPDCGEVVVSAGTAPPTQLAQKVHGALRNYGFDAHLYDGDSCPALGATTNVQGVSTRQIGADFLHIETIKPIRDEPARRSLLAGTIADALLPPTVTPLRPAPGSSTRDRTPTVRAAVKDVHTNLAKADIKLSIDGRQITTFVYNRATDRLGYTPGRNLALGGHTIKVRVTDAAGNFVTKRWRFKVVR